MEFLMDSAGWSFDLAGQVFPDAGIDSENGRQKRIFWLGE
jgi:hypothetical protein